MSEAVVETGGGQEPAVPAVGDNLEPAAAVSVQNGSAVAEVGSVDDSDGDRMVIDLQQEQNQCVLDQTSADCVSTMNTGQLRSPVTVGQPIVVQPVHESMFPLPPVNQSTSANISAIEAVVSVDCTVAPPVESPLIQHHVAPVAVASVDAHCQPLQPSVTVQQSWSGPGNVSVGSRPQFAVQSTAAGHIGSIHAATAAAGGGGTGCGAVGGGPVECPTVFAATTQIMCSSETAGIQSPIDVAMACQQQFIGSATIHTGQSFQPGLQTPQAAFQGLQSGQTFHGLQTGQTFQGLQHTGQTFQGLQTGQSFQGLQQTGQGFQGPLMALPQTLQVIQAPHQFVQQQQFQQQYMFQANPIQTFQPVPTAVSLSAAPRSVAKSPNILPIAPQSVSAVRMSTVATKTTNNNSQQQTSYNTSKPQHNASVVIGQLGMMQNANIAQQTLLSQQPRAISLCQVQQPLNLGQVGQQLQFGQPLNLGQVNQPLTFGPTGQPITLGHVNQTLNLSQVNQVIGNTGQIRFTTMPNFGFNAAGQLVGTGQTLVNFQNVPLMQQQMLTSQATTILGSQPLYIRTAEPFIQQQTPTIAVANVQTVAPIRNMIVPAAPRRLQVHPNNAIAPSTVSSVAVAAKLPTVSLTNSTVSSISTKPSPKLVKPLTHTAATTTSPVVHKSLAPASVVSAAAPATVMPHLPPPCSPPPPSLPLAPLATVTHSSPVRHTKPTMSVAVMPKPAAVITSVPMTTTQCVAMAATPGVVISTPSTEQSTSTSSSCTVTTVTVPTVSLAAVSSTSAVNFDLDLKIPVTEASSDITAVASSPLKLSAGPGTETSGDKIKNSDDETELTVSVPTKTSKHRKPKILTHVIEGFIIQEASEPFPVQGSSLVSQLWPLPKVASTVDDGYSSPKSEKESDDGEDEQLSGASLNKRLKLESEELVDDSKAAGVTTASTTSASDSQVEPRLAVVVDPRLVCEFCGKRDFVNNLTRSRRFCSVTCSKRFSAYSMRKTADGSVIGRPSTLNKQPRRTVAAGLARTISTTSAGPCPTTAAAAVVQSTVRSAVALTDCTVVATASVAVSEMKDSDTNYALPPTAAAAGDISSRSQSPPALERVERVIDKDSSSDDGVLIPPRPLAQWNVQDVYDFIRTLPGCGMYADEFRQQEIDGSALMLLKEDHLMTTMNVKLGPALKICSRISSLKD